MSSKIEEALEHIKSAERSLKTSLLKWRPDYDSAADSYSQAATCYRIARLPDKSKECLMKAAQCYKENRAFFHAAKSYEQAILLCKESGSPQEIYKLAEDACRLYQQHGSNDSGATALDKAAKIVEQHSPEIALQLYQHAVEVASIEDGSRQAAEYVSKVSRLLVKLQRYNDAADSLRKEIGIQQQNDGYQAIGRLTVALVLVQLAREDCVAAEKAFKEWGNYCDAPEVQTLEMLVQAYDDEDPEGARSALGSPFIRHMDIEYAHLARIVPLPQGMAVPKSVVRENAAASYVSPSAEACGNQGTSNPAFDGAKTPDAEEDELC